MLVKHARDQLVVGFRQVCRAARCQHLDVGTCSLWNANSALNKHSHIFCALLLSHWNPQHSSHLNFVSMPGHLIGDFAVCK